MIELEKATMQHLIKNGPKIVVPIVARTIRWKVDENLMDGSGWQSILTSQKEDNQA